MTEEKLQRAYGIKILIDEFKREVGRYEILLSKKPEKLRLIFGGGECVDLDIRRASEFVRGELMCMYESMERRMNELKREFDEL